MILMLIGLEDSGFGCTVGIRRCVQGWDSMG